MAAGAWLMVAWGLAAFGWLGLVRPIDDLGFCGTSAPVKVAVLGYASSDETGVADACRDAAEQLTIEATLVALGPLVGAWMLFGAVPKAASTAPLPPPPPRPGPPPPAPATALVWDEAERRWREPG